MMTANDTDRPKARREEEIKKMTSYEVDKSERPFKEPICSHQDNTETFKNLARKLILCGHKLDILFKSKGFKLPFRR